MQLFARCVATEQREDSDLSSKTNTVREFFSTESLEVTPDLMQNMR